jgi:hypothetical protein
MTGAVIIFFPLLHCVYFAGKFRFKVGSLIFMNNRTFRQFIEQGSNAWKFFSCFCLISQLPEFLDGIPHSLGIIPVTDAFCVVAADPFDR